MATIDNDIILSSDIYEISEFVDTIQQNNSDLDKTTLALGIFGYLNDMFTVSMQNTVRMTAEYSNEAIATRAKYPKNVITHALNLGIKDINATPATFKSLILISEDELLKRMKDDEFTLYSDCKIYLGDYEFHFDYDIIIKRNMILAPDPITGDMNEENVYTAMYDMAIKNELSDITSPYLPPIAKFDYYENQKLLALTVKLRQVEYRTEIKKIITDNPLENKVMNFSFDGQLAAFDVDVYESDEDRVHLFPVYEGLYDETPGLKYCNYSYLNSNTIRIKFDRDSYEPMLNCEVHINIKETQGSKGNFKFVEDIQIDLESEKTNYDGMYIILKPIGDKESVGGLDKKTVDQLKKIIPKEALAHGTIINTQDLENFFNQIDDENCKVYFHKNKDNPLTRLYYAYIVTKQQNNIIPTNTVDFAFTKDQLKDNITSDGNIILKPGTALYLAPGDKYVRLVNNYNELSYEEKLIMDKTGFLYINPFLCIINKSPLYTSYILDIFNVQKDLLFTYINQNSKYQYIASTVNWYRQYFTDRNKYKMDIEFLQNITDEHNGILITNGHDVIGANLKVIAVFYDNTGTRPFRWIEASFVEYDTENDLFKYQFVFETDDYYDNSNRIKIKNMNDILSDTTQIGFNKEKVKCKLLMFAKFNDGEYGRYGSENWDKVIPNLSGYTLTNEYDIADDLELFYNYTQIMSSDVRLTKFDPDMEEPVIGDTTWYSILRMPVIRSLYIKNEKRINNFIKDVERRRKYIEQSVLELEDSFGVDMKFFNTYGPSTLFYLENGANIDRTNLTLKFKMKPYSLSDVYINDTIIVDIKE